MIKWLFHYSTFLNQPFYHIKNPAGVLQKYFFFVQYNNKEFFMKKIISSLVAFIAGSLMFAATPAKDLLLGTYDFATVPSKTWEIFDGTFTNIDTIGEEYTFFGGFKIKNIIGFVRYDFSCTIKNGEDDFSVEISDMSSYAIDKKGAKLKNGKESKTSASVASQYAEQMKTEIKNRIKAFQESGKIDEEYTKVITSPAFVNVISKSLSDLAMKKFVETNINGKKVSFNVTLESIDENKNPITGETYPLQYKATGGVQVIKDYSLGGIKITDNYTVYIYSNNDKLLSAKKGSNYKVNGTAELKQIGSGLNKFWIYSVNEE